jgi:hypothetical protein
LIDYWLLPVTVVTDEHFEHDCLVPHFSEIAGLVN